ncbi:MAG: DUF680 domain-containing protein [Pseudaminobacter sp.]|nr:DUF680 domain-containing protein [Pseudaminobacter sp.]
MKRTAFALAAILAMTGAAFANDFAATPDNAPAPQAEMRDVDHSATYSVKRQTFFGKLLSRDSDGAADAVQAREAPREPSGIEINPWIVPGFQ